MNDFANGGRAFYFFRYFHQSHQGRVVEDHFQVTVGYHDAVGHLFDNSFQAALFKIEIIEVPYVFLLKLSGFLP